MFGHGFVPRVTERNRAGLARALSPDLFSGEPPDVPWAIVDGAAAAEDPTLVRERTSGGTRVVVDTQAFRYSDSRTWLSPKWSQVPFAPAVPFDGTRQWVEEFVTSDLRFQSAVGGSAYLLPAWFTARAGADPGHLRWVLEAATRLVGDVVPAKPMLATLPVQRTALDAGRAAAQVLHHGVAGVYVLVSPWRPVRDPVDSLAAIAAFLLDLEHGDFSVLIGRGGALTPVWRALGVSGAEAGLAEAESFDRSGAIGIALPRPREKGKPSPRPGPRIYVPELGLSLAGKQWRQLAGVPAALAAVTCSRRCCRMAGSAELAQDHAVEHSLVCRVEEATAISKLPLSMRAAEAYELIKNRRSRLRQVNVTLRDAGLDPFRHDHVENQLALITRFAHRDKAA